MPALPDLVVLASGGGDEMIPAAFNIASILVQLALIIVVARLAGYAAGKVGIPPVVGEIAAGVLLGPSLLGAELSGDIFPLDTRPLLGLLANIGLVLFMFVVGLELDISLVKGRGRVAGSVSVASILLPFSMGIGLAALVLDDLRPSDADFWPFALFIGAAMSITAFPVLARILTDRRMHRTETGGLALACAATDDVLAWTLLAVVIGIAGGEGEGPGWLVFLAIPFALLMIFVVRPALTVLTRMYLKAGELTPSILSIVLVGLVLSSAATEYLHVHFIFGAFLFGAVMPHEQAAALRHEILVRLEQISVLLLLPVFFLVSGLKVDIRGLGADNILPLIAILAVAIAGKYVGAYLGARSAGVPHWQANALGILMNTRGLTELIILNVGLQLGLLSPELFTMMVIMALVTTVMTGPLLKFAYPDRRVNRDIAEAERAALGDAASDRVLVIAQEGRSSQAMVELAAGLLEGSTRSTEIVVASLAPQVRKLEVGTGLSGELAEMAAAMERQEALVRRGRELGVSVRIIAHPSADPETDLTELVGVLAPQFFLAWTDDELAARVSEHSPSPVLTVAPGLDSMPSGSPVRVTWTQGADGDAALLLGCRVAGALGSPLDVDGDGRRVARIRETLTERGIRLAEPDEGTFPITFAAPGGHADVLVRADRDANPVDFSTADLGVSSDRARNELGHVASEG
jgi:Kef-type K+ transport system membrane component KefB